MYGVVRISTAGWCPYASDGYTGGCGCLAAGGQAPPTSTRPTRKGVRLSAVDAGQRVEFPRTAAALAEVLLTDLRCRRRWQRHTRRNGRQLPNQAGVAHVLAAAVREGDGVVPHRSALPRSLKDRVSRALTGRLVTAGTLNLFVEAFGMTEEQERRLYTAWEADRTRV